jgi:hypothetical protein
MKRLISSRIFLTVILAISLAACNYPGMQPEASPTLAATNTAAASPTSPPPTATFTAIPPTATATLVPVTPTPLPPTAIPVTPTWTPVPTVAYVDPLAGSKLDGTFEGGTLTFRVHTNGNYVIPKSVNLKKISCNEGKTLSDLITFEPPPFFEVVEGKFTMFKDTTVTISGQFITPTTARGTLSGQVKSGGKNCTFGPLSWSAAATAGE